MTKKYENISLEEKVGQLLMFAFQGDSYNEQLDMQIRKLKVGGIIYFSRNIKNKEQVQRLNEKIKQNAKKPPFIAIDQEGGIVQRIVEGMPLFPGAMAISASQMDNYDVCYEVGKELRSIGFNVNFAPVADCNNNPLNPVINSRSYSDDPKVCGWYASRAAQGFQDALILPTSKHFPGHGDTKVDSHLSLPKVDKSIEELEKMEFIPFQETINNGIEGIMASHILYPALDDKFPATLSKKIITGILKEKMGFKGLIVTDSLTMGAIYNTYSHREIVRYACNAGIDLLVFCGKADINEQIDIYNSFIEEVKIGNIPMERIDESYEKIIRLKEKYINSKQTEVEYKKGLGKLISEKSITLVKNENVLPLDKKNRILVISPKIKVFTLVDNDNVNYLSLGEVFNAHELICDELIYEENDDIIKKVIDIQKNYDKIILGTYNVRQNGFESKLFKNLQKEKTIVVSLRSPYDILYLDDVKCYICIYETSKLSFESLTKCLINNKFEGKLPVQLYKEEF